MLTTNSSDQAAILGFSTGSVAVVYYHVAGERTAKAYPFVLNGKRFNQIMADRAGTPLASLPRGQVLPVSATNGRTFVQPATGVTTKLSFPTLTQLVQSGRIAINRASLIITPTNPNDSRLYYPPLLVLAEVDEKNQLRRVPGGGFPYLVPQRVQPTEQPTALLVSRKCLATPVPTATRLNLAAISSQLFQNSALIRVWYC